MKDSIATASRNLLQIKRRQYSHKAFRALQKIAGGRFEGGESVLLYPKLRSKNQFADLRNRIAWYLPADSYQDFEIHVLGQESTLRSEGAPSPPAQNDFPSEHLPFAFHDESSFQTIAKTVDRILVWDKRYRIDGRTLAWIQKLDIIDPDYYSTIEPQTWGRLMDRVRTPNKDASKANFRELERMVDGVNESYVFATGPSLDTVFDFDIPSDALSVICNSIVRNDEMLEHLQPDVLVFADPVFHFGPSRYANEFREDAASALKTHDIMAVIPDKQHSLFSGHYPHLSDRIIGLDRHDVDEPILPTSERLEVKGTNNIMTLFMLPLAMSFTDSVYIVGADGRKEGDSYFWEHSETAQYGNDLMESAIKTHPSFFRDRIYEDYYDEHVKTLTSMIEHGESKGIDFYSLTNSYVPCLSNRQVNSS